ncbi:MAG TPA: CHASE3 domain-containing protein [Pseudolabrys sp.]|uniref:sensor histidine kinase n=1 Tax=Pseudolabrys sp. TaxID=1960880 RepID=UPI002DDD3125|nr:CHASE3 domain-containing protein [Pseudolabrys sp.]HEV2627775.1 CHASE3 domain-containing protein [Pseudolabrys sp.]
MAAKRTPVVSLQPLLLGLGFALLVVISAATVYLVDRAADDLQRLTQTLRVEDQLSNVLLDVRRAESSQRGYLFTNNQDYLKEFYEAEPQARQLLAELRTLTKDNPARQAMLDEATKLIDAKFKEMSATVVLSQQGRRDEARNLVLTGAGRTIADQLRKMIDGAISDEAHLAATRRDQSRQTNRMLLYVTLAGAAVIVIIGILSIVLVQRNMREREATQKEIESTNANLERIVEYRTADLTEANEEIQRFAYIVSHDLRSPLVNIMGFTSELEALRKDIFEQIGKLSAQIAALDAQAAAATAEGQIDQLGEEFDEAIRFIKTSISNMDRLINAVLRLSREGRRQFEPQQVDMDGLLRGIVETVTHRAVELGARIDIGHLPDVESDRLAMEQVFANLVDNALKYGRTGEPLHIEITGRATGAQVVYDVKDNGRGIAPADHARVFELFRRSGAQDRPGEGIGLAHVRALVRRLGGTMGLASQLGQGSTFTVTLPRRWTGGNWRMG